MSENIYIAPSATKKEKYESLLPQVKALIGNETDVVANTANICAALKEAFQFFWVGFYFVKNTELVLGPFQGSIACTRIALGKGVCGTAWQNRQTIVVDNVDEFPGHIACSSLSKSEIVIPVFDKNNNVTMVLDIDSDQLSDFNEVDKFYLEKLVSEALN